MRVLCLDLGSKRVGIAISDEKGWLARPLLTYQRIGPRKDIVNLAAIAHKEDVGLIVLGLPLSLNGDEGPEAVKARAVGEQLAAATHIPITFWDERLTTVEAHNTMEAMGIPLRKRKDKIDQVAAAVILQSYLDSHPQDEPPPWYRGSLDYRLQTWVVEARGRRLCYNYHRKRYGLCYPVGNPSRRSAKRSASSTEDGASSPVGRLTRA